MSGWVHLDGLRFIVLTPMCGRPFTEERQGNVLLNSELNARLGAGWTSNRELLLNPQT